MSENTEIGTVITSPDVAGRIAPLIDDAIERVAFRLELETDEQGRERIVWHSAEKGEGQQTYRVDPDTSFWKRFSIGFMGLLPVESQL